MAFTEPEVHRVTDLTAETLDVAGSNGPFTCLKLRFRQENGEQAEVRAFFSGPAAMSRAHAISAAIILSQPVLEGLDHAEGETRV